MIKLYSEEDFNKAKSGEKLPLKCEYCGKTFYALKKIIKSNEKLGKNKNRFCCNDCRNFAYGKRKKVICINCGKEIIKQKSEYISVNNHFCNSSCAATYNNTHKTKGNRRSKLEMYLEEILPQLFPNIDFTFNDKTAINSELDIYIPSLKLAFELNGIFHYEPIYGNNKFQRIVENDNNKFQLCQENGISLYIIDTTSQKKFKKETSEKFIEIISNIIKQKKCKW